jgi:hypothetical protein
MELGPYESIGLDDCPPATGIPDDTRGQLLLTGTERAKRRAQRVYHAVLVQRLAERKLTAQQLLEEQIGWFWLRFTPEELDDLLESAAEVYSDVERVDERGDTTAKYRATPKGEKLPKPRTSR